MVIKGLKERTNFIYLQLMFLFHLKDVRFLRFIIDNITKYSVFLTGTPIQKSAEDIISIFKFLNVREINTSNEAQLIKKYNILWILSTLVLHDKNIEAQLLFFKNFDKKLGFSPKSRWKIAMANLSLVCVI